MTDTLALAHHGQVRVRDSKQAASPVLVFGPAAWSAFVDGLRNGTARTR